MEQDFIKRANAKRNEHLSKTEFMFAENKEKWAAKFAEHFKALCCDFRLMQNASELSAISYLEYTMLYTNFAKRLYVSEVRVYAEASYLDKNQLGIKDYDISFLFMYYDQLWDELIELRRRYTSKVSANNVTAYMLDSLSEFYSYFIRLVKEAIECCVKTEPFAGIKKNEKFAINVGDYMSETETIFTLEQKWEEQQEEPEAAESETSITSDYSQSVKSPYFVMGQINKAKLNSSQIGQTDSAKLYETNDISILQELDYIHNEWIISDRLKQLFEVFMPYMKWESVSYIKPINSRQKNIATDPAKQMASPTKQNAQADLEKALAVFWKFDLHEYTPHEKSIYSSDGIIEKLILGETIPTLPIFKVRPPQESSRRPYSIIVHLSVAESMTRRGYLEVDLIRI